jgi:hypothetical protein
MSKDNRQVKLAQEQQQLTCLQKHVSKNTVIKIDGEAFKQAEIADLYVRHLALLQASEAAYENWLAAVAKEREAEKALRPARSVLAQFFKNQFGAKSQQAIDFGIKTRAAARPTVEARSEAVEKSRATRAARHEVGKKERLLIHADVIKNADPPAPTATPTATAATNGASNGVANGASNGTNGVLFLNGQSH